MRVDFDLITTTFKDQVNSIRDQIIEKLNKQMTNINALNQTVSLVTVANPIVSGNYLKN